MESFALAGVNQCHSSGLLTATGAETVYDTTVQIDFSINGIMYSKATVADGATPTTDLVDSAAFTALAASRGCVFLWCLNASGTVGIAQGEIVTLDASNNFVDLPEFPLVDTGTWVPFAYQVIKNGSTGSAWTIGTSNWNATGITSSIKNLNLLPSRPQAS